jgi:hypothetical protein
MTRLEMSRNPPQRRNAGAKRRCPEEARQLYRRAGESGASVRGCRKRGVDLATVGWKRRRRRGGDGSPAPFTTAPVPAGKSPAVIQIRKKGRQDSDISQHAIGVPTTTTTITITITITITTTNSNSNSNSNSNTGIITRTGISTPRCSTSIIRHHRGIRHWRRCVAPKARCTSPAGRACLGFCARADRRLNRLPGRVSCGRRNRHRTHSRC